MYKKCYAPNLADFTRRVFFEHLPPNVGKHLAPKLASFAKRFTLTPECQNDKPLTSYLNDEAVQKAIHVRMHDQSDVWELCSEQVFQRYHKVVLNTASFFHTFFSAIPDGRIMLYAGDVDMACNFIGVQTFAQSLGRKISAGFGNGNGQLQIKSRTRAIRSSRLLTLSERRVRALGV